MPVLVSTNDGAWLVYLELNESGGCVRARHTESGRTVSISSSDIDCGDVTAASHMGDVLVVWSRLVDGVYQLFSAYLENPEPEQITQSRASVLGPKLAVNSGGTAFLVWQEADANGRYGIRLSGRHDGSWQEPARISGASGNNWCPDLAACADGSIAVAWDGYTGAGYDVYLRFVAADMSMKPIMRLTDGATNTNAAVAALADGGVCVAWNSGPTPAGGSLHPKRGLEVRLVRDGSICSLPSDLQKDRINISLPGLHDERPQLFAAKTGAIWLAFRHNAGNPDKKDISRTKRRWEAFLTCFDGSTWAIPASLAGAYGLSTGAISICSDPGGSLLVAAAGEGGDRMAINVETGVYLFKCRTTAAQPMTSIPGDGVDAFPAAAPPPPPEPHSVRHAGTDYSLFYGDLHRHTELSICHCSADGSTEDAYRYGRDGAPLDFLATTDHASQTARPDMWRQMVGAVNRYNVPGHFTSFFAYEWNGSGMGRRHRIIVSARSIAPQPFDVETVDGVWHHVVEDLWKTLPRESAITIPHTTGSPGFGTKWGMEPCEAADPVMEPLVEIYQPCTGSSECLDAPIPCTDGSGDVSICGDLDYDGTVAAALRMGLRMGFIASSDHGSTYKAYACVYATENTRAALMEAMLARRTFAATARIALEFTLGDAFMGGTTVAEGEELELHLAVRGTAPLREVVLMRDSERYVAWPGKSEQLDIEHKLPVDECKGHYFYLRVLQADTNMAWSSPIWVD